MALILRSGSGQRSEGFEGIGRNKRNFYWMLEKHMTHCVNLPEPSGTKIKYYFWASMWVFLDKISISVSGLSRVDCLLQCGCASSNSLRARIEQKRQRKNFFAPFPSCLPT